MIEKMVLEEFGRCLLSIIHTANGTKGEFCLFLHFDFSSCYTVDSLLRDTFVKRTPRVGPCLSLLPLFDSL